MAVAVEIARSSDRHAGPAALVLTEEDRGCFVCGEGAGLTLWAEPFVSRGQAAVGAFDAFLRARAADERPQDERPSRYSAQSFSSPGVP